MVRSGIDLAVDSLTFSLAYAAYVLLCAAVLSRWKPVVWVLAAVALAHVYCVWHLRFHWSFAAATSRGYLGFALFHAALLSILVATAVAPWKILPFTLAVVTLGAVGAAFRYDFVAWLRWPVVAAAGATAVLLVRRHFFQCR